MKKDDFPEARYTENFIRAAQYIVRLTSVQNVLEELGKIVVSYFGAEWVAFAGTDDGGEIYLAGSTMADASLRGSLLRPETQEKVRDVFNSGFLASGSIVLGEPYETTFLPLTEMNRTTTVMIVAHGAGEPAGAERLNLYLALAGLAGSTMGRISTEQQLRRHQSRLEELVEERTRRLRESEQRWAITLSSIGDAVIATDIGGRVTFMNAVAEGLTGWTLDEAAGTEVKRIFNIVNEQTRKEVESPVGRVLREGTIVGLANHTILVRKDGTEVPIDDSGAPIRDGSDRIVGVVLVFRDITERRQAEGLLQKAYGELETRVEERTGEFRRAYEKLKKETAQREQLETQLRQAQKIEALGTLSGGIAHDFNNILAAIIGFTELVAGHTPEGSPDARYLERVMEASLRGRELVKQMLTFSRRAEQEKKPLRLAAIVKETIGLIRATIPSTIRIKVDIPGEPGSILGDPTQMQQVLMNLCTNAAFAMRDKGGVLGIGLIDLDLPPSDGNPHGIAPGHYVKLTVSDTGTGIPSDIMDRIFDPFFTTRKLGEGTGLGLSVVHGIVRQSDGHIIVESEPGGGATFSIYFPKIQEAAKNEGRGNGEIPAGHERILFVDDEELLVEMGEEILAGLGYEVTCRTNSREALSLLRENPSRFDLVITDQTMPELAGVELAKEILAIRPDIPIIMCTGFSHIVDAGSAKAAGISAFLMKPLTKKEIAGTVRDVLDCRTG